MDDIKIKEILPNLENSEIKAKEHDMPQYNQSLPKPYFRSIVVGSSGCGKTNAILNMLQQMEKHLTRIFVISISVYNDPKQKEIYEAMPNCVVFQTPTEDTLKSIMEEINRLNDEYEKYKRVLKAWKKFKKADYDDSVLDPSELIDLWNCQFNPEELEVTSCPNHMLIIDDAAGLPIIKSKYFQSIVIRLRHWRCNIMLTVQNYKLANNTYRRNSSFFMLYRIPDINQLKDVFNEISIFFDDFDHFKKVYDYCVGDSRYNFMYIDTNDKERPVRKNFNEVLEVKLK